MGVALNYTTGGKRITCIVKDGNITNATETQYQGGEMVVPHGALASAVKKGDIVNLSTDTANTAEATGGDPVITPVTGAGVAFGIVMTNPKWVVYPSSSQTTWASMLSKKYYRICEVWVACHMIIEAICPEASSNAVTPGNSLIWDNSADGFVYGRDALSLANSAVFDSSGDDTGANGFLTEPIALHYAATDDLYVAAAIGLVPIRTQA